MDYKLTFPCEVTDINGNVVNTEKTVVFSNKEELLEYISGDTDGDNYGSGLLRIRKYDNNFYTQLGKTCNHIAHLVGLRGAKPEKKLSLSDLTHKWFQLDYDGVSTAEENAFKWLYGPKEKYWRSQREFFAFVAAHDNIEKIALTTAAQAVYDAMRLAGEDEETVRAYKEKFVKPAIKRHQ